MAKRCKVQFYLSEEGAQGLHDLAALGEGTTLSEVLRKSLSFYRAAVEVVEGGGKVQFVDAEGERSTVVFSGFGSKG